jgi:glycosyltransferase involved in cell wall biosynthesis
MVAGIEAQGGKVNLMPASNNVFIMLKAFAIIKYIRRNNIELVHCHLPWAGFVGRIIHMITKIPVFYSEHNKQERYHFITKLLNKISFNKQSRVIAVSEDVAESINKNIKPKVPVQTILNGVNTENFIRNHLSGRQKREEYQISQDCILIGTIAVFRFQKRLKEWIEVFKSVHDIYPNVKGCIIGDGILKNEIMSHLKTCGMENHIIFPGLQTDVMPWLSAMDIFMMTSEFEGLPIAMLEAMSMECAIVTTDAGGIKEVVRNEIDGFVETVENWRNLKNPIDRLLQHPNELKTFGVKARQRVMDQFSLTTMVHETEKAYLTELNKN